MNALGIYKLKVRGKDPKGKKITAQGNSSPTEAKICQRPKKKRAQTSPQVSYTLSLNLTT